MNAQRSLHHEYELFVEREIEGYKDSISRNALLAIGDEAVAILQAQAQTTLTELVLWEEVDRIIGRRLGLPPYRTWRRRHLKLLAELARPEHWGMTPASVLVRALSTHTERGHVLVAGIDDESTTLYSAAQGYAVTALDCELDAVERVMAAAEAVGLGSRVRGCVGDLVQWSPDVALHAVVCTPTAFAGLTPAERARVIELLQGATLDGGIHLVRALVAGHADMAVDELRDRYAGWTIALEGVSDARASATFLAQKPIVAH